MNNLIVSQTRDVQWEHLNVPNLQLFAPYL